MTANDEILAKLEAIEKTVRGIHEEVHQQADIARSLTKYFAMLDLLKEACAVPALPVRPSFFVEDEEPINNQQPN